MLNEICIQKIVAFQNARETEFIILSSLDAEDPNPRVQMGNVASFLDHVMRRPVLCYMRTTKPQISLCIRAVWSASKLYTA